MVRSFDGTELGEDELCALCADAMYAPTAGHSRGVEAVVLAGRSGTQRYLDAATDADWRARSPRAPGLARAGGAILVVCSPAAYAARYAAGDKSSSRLGDEAAWPVPYWYGDAGAFAMALLLLAEERGRAACFLGAFRNAPQVLLEVDAPSDRRLYGAVLVGVADGADVRSASLARPGATRVERVVRGRFATG
jgi:nitroreductase